MRCQDRHPRCGAGLTQQGPDGIRVPVPAVAAAEDEVLIMPQRTDAEALFELVDPVTAERRRRFFHELDAATQTRLRASPGQRFALAINGAGGIDPHYTILEVEVGPGE